ncbi:5-oxoprolinase subunit PxpA [Zobellia amurskyensis]|uniref:5-oxoprolinase subunit PxpA n=1 Tax=Zobellia amurskyensis TaxID=248905 RepID=A0A7X3D304_9FLAO|nr:5-oxoprolinase subunit PxpA [Zobellia amurskyensis]MUH37175.1 5-oxoprolinase subunit PxpA [Zobellia amurskyensis]
MTNKYIDLNCDVGEGVGNEEELLPMLSSCNIACGGHTGNKNTMTEVVKLAKRNNVSIGAHPSYPDAFNFGRISIEIDDKELIGSIRCQVDSLLGVINEQNVKLNHIKPHGALYNDIVKNASLALCFLEAIEKYKNEVYIYAPYASEIARKASDKGFKVKYEAFADRNYNTDLSLVSRSEPKALLTDKTQVLEHVVRIVNLKKVTTIRGEDLSILADTFCVHGDTPSALEIVLYLTKELPNYNIFIKK